MVIDGNPQTVSQETHMCFDAIVEAIKSKNWPEVRKLVDIKKAIVDFAQGHVSIAGDDVFWMGKPLHNSLTTRLVEMFKEGFDINPMVLFIQNIMTNPSERSRNQLYTFLENCSLPITDDGHFLAYKKVRSDYKDIHSGTISNKVGEVVSMDRSRVSEDPNSHCSSGLHFCSIEYVHGFGGSNDPIMILKINPKDVVSIPHDTSSKGRCCHYQVVDQVGGVPEEAFPNPVDTRYTPRPWPFPTGDRPAADDSNDYMPTGEALYTLIRAHGGDIVDDGLTLDDARERVQKNIRQKKAKLMIIDENGNTVV